MTVGHILYYWVAYYTTYDVLFPGKKQKCSLEVDFDVRSYVGYTCNPVWYSLDVLYTANRAANIHE
jgi:hypothetical protein